MVQTEGESDMIRCSQCGRGFDRQVGDRFVAALSGSIMGDEYTESYYFCSQCQVYTVKIYHDRFLGELRLEAQYSGRVSAAAEVNQ